MLGKRILNAIVFTDNTQLDIIQYLVLHLVEFWLFQGAAVGGTSQVLFNTISWAAHAVALRTPLQLLMLFSMNLSKLMTVRKLMTAM